MTDYFTASDDTIGNKLGISDPELLKKPRFRRMNIIALKPLISDTKWEAKCG